MKIDQLIYFLEAAEQEHVGKASRRLAISSSTISHAIAALEEELGRELFLRKGRRVQLTLHGKLLREKARRLLSEMEGIRREMASEEVELEGHYKLAATHVLCAEILVPAWAQVQNENPKLTSEIFTLRSSQVVRGVTTGEFDFGVCFNPQEHPDLSMKIIRSGSLCLAVRRKHPILKFAEKARLQKLSSYPTVLPKAFQGVDICESHPIFEKFQITPRPDCLVDSYEIAARKVSHSLDWTFLPDWIIKTEGLIEVARPPGWEAPYHVSAIWSKQRWLPEALETLTKSLEILAK